MSVASVSKVNICAECVTVFRITSISFLFMYKINNPLDIRINAVHISEPGSSVGIATDYRLHGPGSNPGGDEIFRLS